MTAISASASGSTASRSSGDTEAAMRTKRTPMSMSTRVSSNSSVSEMSIVRLVTEDNAHHHGGRKAGIVAEQVGGDHRGHDEHQDRRHRTLQGVQGKSRSSTTNTKAPTTPTSAPTVRLIDISPTCQSALTKWKASTPSSAPIGSTSTPSHLRRERTSFVGRMNASSGSTPSARRRQEWRRSGAPRHGRSPRTGRSRSPRLRATSRRCPRR